MLRQLATSCACNEDQWLWIPLWYTGKTAARERTRITMASERKCIMHKKHVPADLCWHAKSFDSLLIPLTIWSSKSYTSPALFFSKLAKELLAQRACAPLHLCSLSGDIDKPNKLEIIVNATQECNGGDLRTRLWSWSLHHKCQPQENPTSNHSLCIKR